MKLNLLALSVAASFAFASTANAAVSDSWTVGAGLGWAHAFDHSVDDLNGYYVNPLVTKDDGSFADAAVSGADMKKNGLGFKLYGEYNFTDWFGLGVGYNFIGMQKKYGYVSYDTDAGLISKLSNKMHANIAEVYGKFAYPLDNFGSDVFFKVGPTYSWFSGLTDGTSHKVGAVVGVGAQWALNESFAIRAGYDYFYRAAKDDVELGMFQGDSVRIDEGLLYVGVQYTFGGNKAAPVKPAQKVEQVSEKHTLDAGILFPFDGSVLSQEGKDAVSTIVTSSSDLQNAQYEVYGYTDRIGSDAYNLKLSDKRADAVSAELGNHGITPVVSDGRGKASPVTGNKCDSVKGRNAVINCLAPDRRVEVLVSGQKVTK